MAFSRQILTTVAAMATAMVLPVIGQGMSHAIAQQTPPSARVFGSISINSGNAPSGAVVTAYGGTSGNTPCGTASGAGVYNGTVYFVDLDSSQAPCSNPGNTITFKVNGQNAAETTQVPPIPGTAVQQNLTVGGAAASGSATYSAGWNLVGAPAGTVFSQASNPMYTYQATDTAYQTVPNTQPVSAGYGYWAYFTGTTTVTLSGTSSPQFATTIPAGQFVMVGNPSSTATVTVSGSDVVYTFDPVANNYVTTGTTLRPGQGAWVYSANGGTITIN